MIIIGHLVMLCVWSHIACHQQKEVWIKKAQFVTFYPQVQFLFFPDRRTVKSLDMKCNPTNKKNSGLKAPVFLVFRWNECEHFWIRPAAGSVTCWFKKVRIIEQNLPSALQCWFECEAHIIRRGMFASIFSINWYFSKFLFNTSRMLLCKKWHSVVYLLFELLQSL